MPHLSFQTDIPPQSMDRRLVVMDRQRYSFVNSAHSAERSSSSIELNDHRAAGLRGNGNPLRSLRGGLRYSGGGSTGSCTAAILAVRTAAAALLFRLS